MTIPLINPEPSLCCWLGALLFGLLYLRGLSALWQRAGTGKGVSTRQVSFFVAGWLLSVAPILSGLHVLGRHVFVLHMAEHEVLMVLAAPLLILARPAPVLLWGLPSRIRRDVRRITHATDFRQIWTWLTRPGPATSLHALAIWLWHWPPLFQWALVDEGVHTLQHLSFFLTALLFWWSVLSRESLRAGLVPTLALFATAVQTSALGALLTFSRTYWYTTSPYLGAICGLTRQEDQQLAGLVMWVPSGLSYLGAAFYALHYAVRQWPTELPKHVIHRS
jgi:putative membrane protein